MESNIKSKTVGLIQGCPTTSSATMKQSIIAAVKYIEENAYYLGKNMTMEERAQIQELIIKHHLVKWINCSKEIMMKECRLYFESSLSGRTVTFGEKTSGVQTGCVMVVDGNPLWYIKTHSGGSTKGKPSIGKVDFIEIHTYMVLNTIRVCPTTVIIPGLFTETGLLIASKNCRVDFPEFVEMKQIKSLNTDMEKEMTRCAGICSLLQINDVFENNENFGFDDNRLVIFDFAVQHKSTSRPDPKKLLEAYKVDLNQDILRDTAKQVKEAIENTSLEYLPEDARKLVEGHFKTAISECDAYLK
ncbi:hypothetical protein AKO1_015862 [Acrasis kona]|uniref:Uncharacterized protein n=1 Tax=Acrasis kona TaxID=1008807 RepID=A0AAW2ZFV7_9EUKA